MTSHKTFDRRQFVSATSLGLLGSGLSSCNRPERPTLPCAGSKPADSSAPAFIVCLKRRFHPESVQHIVEGHILEGTTRHIE